MNIGQLLHKLAKQGDLQAQYTLAMQYHLDKNHIQKKKYLISAADNGYVEAQLWLADSYKLGDGFERNLNMADHYYSLAASQGSYKASCLYGCSL